MRRQLVPSVVSMVIFTVILGIGFPLVILGIGQVAFTDKADGSIIERNGTAVGSSLIGQAFTDQEGRAAPRVLPVAARRPPPARRATAAGYDPTLSSGSNLGPTNPELPEAGRRSGSRSTGRSTALADDGGAGRRGDRVGLGPRSRTSRSPTPGCRRRGWPTSAASPSRRVDRLVDDHTTSRAFGILGEKAVNVLRAQPRARSSSPAERRGSP